jgi:hypothetical protein
MELSWNVPISLTWSTKRFWTSGWILPTLSVIDKFMRAYNHSLVEICDFVTNEFATSCDYLTFTTTVGYIYDYCLHLKPLATTL